MSNNKKHIGTFIYEKAIIFNDIENYLWIVYDQTSLKCSFEFKSNSNKQINVPLSRDGFIELQYKLIKHFNKKNCILLNFPVKQTVVTKIKNKVKLKWMNFLRK